MLSCFTFIRLMSDNPLCASWNYNITWLSTCYMLDVSGKNVYDGKIVCYPHKCYIANSPLCYLDYFLRIVCSVQPQFTFTFALKAKTLHNSLKGTFDEKWNWISVLQMFNNQKLCTSVSTPVSKNKQNISRRQRDQNYFPKIKFKLQLLFAQNVPCATFLLAFYYNYVYIFVSSHFVW